MKVLNCALTGLTALGFNVSDVPLNREKIYSVNELEVATTEIARDSLSFKSPSDSAKCVKKYLIANKIWGDALDKTDVLNDSVSAKAERILNNGFEESDKNWEGGYEYSNSISNPTAREAYLKKVFNETENYKYNVFKKKIRFIDSMSVVIENIKNDAFHQMAKIKQEAKELYCKPVVKELAQPKLKTVVKKMCRKCGSKKIKL